MSGPCDDGNDCTLDDACVEGTCLGGRNAPAGSACGPGDDPCWHRSCGEAGACVEEPLSDVPCDDLDQCTIEDTCRAGFCAGHVSAAVLPCDDHDACTVNDHCAGRLCSGTAGR